MTTVNTPPDQQVLLTPAQTSELLTIPVRTLAYWRSQRTGPLAIRVGAHVRYRLSDLNAWIEDQATAAQQERAHG